MAYLVLFLLGIWPIVDGVFKAAGAESPAITFLPIAQVWGPYAAILVGTTLLAIAFWARSQWKKLRPPQEYPQVHGWDRWNPERLGKWTRRSLYVIVPGMLIASTFDRPWEIEYWNARGTAREKFALVNALALAIWQFAWLIEKYRRRTRVSQA